MKKKLLIAIGNAYTFHSIFVPFIQDNNKIFSFTVLVINLYMPKRLLNLLTKWKESGVIDNYYLIPYAENTRPLELIRLHCLMKKVSNIILRKEFDLCVIGSSIYTWERYLTDCALNSSTPIVGIWLTCFGIIGNLSIEDGGLSEKKAEAYINDLLNEKMHIRNKDLLIETNNVTLYEKVIIVLKLAKRTLVHIYIKYLSFLDRVFLPFLLVRKIFCAGKLDEVTWFGTDRFDVVITFQRVPEIFFRSMYKDAKVIRVKHLLSDNCRCSGEASSKALIILSTIIGTEETIDLLVRDLKIVINNSSASHFDIRPHPGTSYREIDLLVKKLKEESISASITGNDYAIREIVCDYIGVVGYSSSALIEASEACESVFVVGFEAASKAVFNNPKLNIGELKSVESVVGWIQMDGSYKATIFCSKKRKINDLEDLKSVLEKIANEPHDYLRS